MTQVLRLRVLRRGQRSQYPLSASLSVAYSFIDYAEVFVDIRSAYLGLLQSLSREQQQVIED